MGNFQHRWENGNVAVWGLMDNKTSITFNAWVTAMILWVVNGTSACVLTKYSFFSNPSPCSLHAKEPFLEWRGCILL
jgi:hypothetical protein